MPEHSRKLYDFLVGIYRQDDVLRTLAPFWIAHQRSANTQRAYARGLRVFEEFAREHGAHPAAVKFADTFRLYLESHRPGCGSRVGRAARWPGPGSRTRTLPGERPVSALLLILLPGQGHQGSDDGVKNSLKAIARPYIDPVALFTFSSSVCHPVWEQLLITGPGNVHEKWLWLNFRDRVAVSDSGWPGSEDRSEYACCPHVDRAADGRVSQASAWEAAAGGFPGHGGTSARPNNYSATLVLFGGLNTQNSLPSGSATTIQ